MSKKETSQLAAGCCCEVEVHGHAYHHLIWSQLHKGTSHKGTVSGYRALRYYHVTSLLVIKITVVEATTSKSAQYRQTRRIFV